MFATPIHNLFSGTSHRSAVLTITAILAMMSLIGVANAATPVAHVYVAEPTQILGYNAAPDGTLTAIPGSPFPISVFGMAVTGSYLFGTSFDGVHVNSYHIQANGSLVFATSTNVAKFNTGTTCPNLQASPLVLDHTGATLYTVAYHGTTCNSTSYKSFAINKSTGGLSYLGDSGTRKVWNFPLTFSSNNQFAYGAGCVGGLTTPYWAESFGILRRSTSGLLTYTTASGPKPPTKDSSYFFCRSLASASATDDLIVGVYKLTSTSTSLFNQGSMLATYEMQSNGSLTTNSKYNNMPWVTQVGELESLKVSPSGQFIAVAGSNGLIVRHVNEDAAPTRYTGLLTSDLIDDVFWDNANHLYAVSVDGRLHVFTITADTSVEAPGSPYSVPAGGYAIRMIVQPLTH
ncbi:hypothetical protein [Occallatibacter savannae]|uniref:hypothetical protein n=1 Tax=Occallatibacter savannae TaxID=1002691 RepID=UPI0013A57B00|nr:hypothetical protein [Occallatibacter savannae]